MSNSNCLNLRSLLKITAAITPASLLFLALACAAQTGAGKRTSFRPGELWPDDKGVPIDAHGGGILLQGGIYYWFGEHRGGGTASNTAAGVHAYSSSDLYNWKDKGMVFQSSDDPTSEITKGCVMERPKVIHNAKTGKFVLWFHLELKGQGYNAARAAVAVSDRPTGPYSYVGSFRPNKGIWPINITEEDKTPKPTNGLNRLQAASVGAYLRRDFETGQMSRDMTIFVDDDGKAYLVTSAEENATIHIAQLSDDYLGFSGKWARALVGDSNEAPAVFKHGGKYYLISSGTTGWRANPGRSAVADSIFGPWTRLGNPCRGTAEQNANTFESQSTHVLPLPGKPDAFIFMADRWRPQEAVFGYYIWLPIEWENGKPVIRWHDEWKLTDFNPPKPPAASTGAQTGDTPIKTGR
ncbi:MAG: glycoside hydrolase family 43 protein [Verrucomicrobiota bacterium]|jgi:beta-xylosidase